MTELKTNGVRRRRTKHAKKKGTASTNKKQVSLSSTSNKDTSDPSSNKDTSSNTPEQSLWEVAKDTPIVLITMVILIPYAVYNIYLFLVLRHPEIISLATMGVLHPRPAVKLTDPRQVLIMGTISSGTSQVSDDLKKKLGLEIGHENSEASWSFVRDGTVSWFHGVRYIPRPGIDTKEYKKDANQGEALFRSVVDQLCQELQPSMGFHPFMFRDGKCNLRQKWENCWRDECKDILESEWGCGLQHISSAGGSVTNNTCATPYHKTLHQVRHPLRTIESLVTKFCIDGVEGNIQPAFLTFASVLFPQHNFSDMSCIEAAGYYVEEYNTAMVTAKARGYLDDTFRVEEVTPCDVAQLAGFMEEDVVYDSNIERILKICNDEGSKANRLMKSKKNLYNQGQLSLDWDDLLGGKHGSRKKAGDRDLKKRVEKLALKLGYQ